MPLAPDAIMIDLDGAAFTLRPTLRAAIRLNRRDGGFPALVDQIVDGDLGAMANVIDEATDRQTSILDLLRDTAVNGVEHLAEIRDPLIAYLGQLVDTGTKAQDQTAKPNSSTPSAPTITRAEYLARLFAIGTGWLGYTPAEAWACSPSELQAAYDGRLDLLKSIFGSGDDEKNKRQQIPLADRVKATMSALGAKVVKRPKKAGA